MTAPRKICVVTGTRAEYGLMYWLMREIEQDPALELQLIVTGAHLEPRFGNTVDVIERDGFRIDARVPIDLSDDTPRGIVKSTALAASGIADAFETLAPDIVVLLGDRFEIFGAAQAAMITRRVIAHLYGGEVTEGVIDDPIRHAITKMSHLHFTSAASYRDRILQMGESPAHTFNVGAIGLDNIDMLDLLDRDALGEDIGLDLGGGYFLVTYHPVTLNDSVPEAGAQALVQALDAFPDKKVIVTGVNADSGNAAIRRVFENFAMGNAGRVLMITSMGQRRYLSAMKHCDAVVGNSSSGIVEAPSFGVPTVNIGDRQKGRLHAASVIDCAEDAASIASTLRHATGEAHRNAARQAVSPFGVPGVSARIKRVLAETPLHGIIMKKFVDLPLVAAEADDSRIREIS
ncbi:MAG: UDP-N-acetylglucosamine 2-epimerase (hydrolyzing) [Rhodospirillales bacterium]|nr:UDP-N-acetylglucosamine 2-epimerase (hydrolyzing) [Rhodospirillales bacterium]